MKKLFILFSILFLITSCEVDFAEPNFNFDEQTINTCGDVLVLFKINENETLILETEINNLNNIFFTTAIDQESYFLNDKISYRIFNANVTSDYFCQNIPPTVPIPINEWVGSGTLVVSNTISNNNDGTFTYTAIFTINNMVLKNSNGNEIIYETYNFSSKTGTFTN
ncbi:MAG: hypothetical protein L3J23_08945 [Flavobacteriaceae bacterium]|nr:hypothetical protein [Flavobacteriaceae bacterium]